MNEVPNEPRLTRSSDGTLIATHLAGEGPGMPLLIANGLGAGPSVWRATFARLASERTMVTWDHRGLHSSGPAVRGRLGPARHAEDAIAALDAAEISQSVVVGWSSGGRIAVELAAHHPERLAGLILVCAGYGRSLAHLLRLDPGALLPRLAGFAKPLAGSIQGVFERFVARPEIAGLVRQSGFVGASADTAALVGFLRELARCDGRTLFAAYEAVSGSPAPGLLTRIRARTAVIAGDRDRFSPLPMMEEIAARIPEAELSIYEGATHFLPIEFPARLAADIGSFCASLEQSDTSDPG